MSETVEQEKGRIRLVIDGNAWCAIFPHHANLQEGKCAFATIPDGKPTHPHYKYWWTRYDPTKFAALDELRRQYPELNAVPYWNDYDSSVMVPPPAAQPAEEGKP